MPGPTELPILETVAQVVAAMNSRIRDLNAYLKSSFVLNPADADADLGNNRIVNLADPTGDLDGVNLRTLKKLAPQSVTTVPTAKRGVLTFGVDDDGIGENLVGKYGVMPFAWTPTTGFISVVGKPTTDSTFDVMYSRDGGTTWKTIFLEDSKPQFLAKEKTNESTFASFATGFIQGDLVRFDGVIAGGATGIVMVISA